MVIDFSENLQWVRQFCLRSKQLEVINIFWYKTSQTLPLKGTHPHVKTMIQINIILCGFGDSKYKINNKPQWLNYAYSLHLKYLLLRDIMGCATGYVCLYSYIIFLISSPWLSLWQGSFVLDKMLHRRYLWILSVIHSRLLASWYPVSQHYVILLSLSSFDVMDLPIIYPWH